jgi:hypothetical protein
MEKASVAARVRAAARAGALGAHRERGFADVCDWMARLTGSSTASVKAALDTAAALSQQPEAKAALEAGELSMTQAGELVKTEAACPGSAAGLLEIAKRQSLKTLKEEARDRRVRAVEPETLHSLQQGARVFRHWRTSLGMVAGAFELPPEVGVPIISRLEAETDRLWQQARQTAKAAVTTERRAAVAADAFVRLVETGSSPRANRRGRRRTWNGGRSGPRRRSSGLGRAIVSSTSAPPPPRRPRLHPCLPRVRRHRVYEAGGAVMEWGRYRRRQGPPGGSPCAAPGGASRRSGRRGCGPGPGAGGGSGRTPAPAPRTPRPGRCW